MSVQQSGKPLSASSSSSKSSGTVWNNKGNTYQSTLDIESPPNGNGHRTSEISSLLTAQDAYRNRDVKSSILYHNQKSAMAMNGKKSQEHHGGAGSEHIKSIVYGGLDGIITTFATVTSVAGADLAAAVIVVLGISHLFADGLSMGMGDAMSSQAEIDYNVGERKREKWEMDNNMPGEIQEMVELYMEKGISKEDAETIINTLAKYPEAFLDHMMVEELQLMPPDEDDSPLKDGLYSMLAFMVFGSVPLLPYLICLIPGIHFSANFQLYSSVVATVITLFVLGSLKGKLVDHGSQWYYSGLVMALNGSFAAIVGYLIGWVMAKLVGDDAALLAAA